MGPTTTTARPLLLLQLRLPLYRYYYYKQIARKRPTFGPRRTRGFPQIGPNLGPERQGDPCHRGPGKTRAYYHYYHYYHYYYSNYDYRYHYYKQIVGKGPTFGPRRTRGFPQIGPNLGPERQGDSGNRAVKRQGHTRIEPDP